MARFIVFEGGEASGKSTQSARLAERLGAVHTREPGGTAIGARLRELMLDARTTGLADRAEALLMAADRAQHVAEVVRPALAAGPRTSCPTATSGRRSRTRGTAGACRSTSCGASRPGRPTDLWPDLVVFLGVPAEVAAARAAGAPDRLEAAGVPFHERVAEGYRALAAADPDRWVMVDGTDSADEVEAAVWAAVRSRLPDVAG